MTKKYTKTVKKMKVVTNLEQWEIDRNKEKAMVQKAFDALTKDQVKSLYKTHDALVDALDMINDCRDLYLSDVKRLESAYWSLKHNFNLEDKEDD
jgi:hypothetical protein|tara:strand:- start:274 stop:558 length:285 start_codon:yes stop_codon:yes gene_type:complete